jgi:glycosyltransferase involved in cell wall biosynthesis
MKVLYDHQMFSLQKYGGVTKYFCELIKNLPQECEYDISFAFSDNHYLKEDQAFFKKRFFSLPSPQFKGKGFLMRQIYLLNQLYSARAISSKKYNLLHPTFYNNYFIDILKTPFIITVHDLTAFKFKETYLRDDPFRSQMEKVVKKANRIIAISENTKKDVIEFFSINPEKIDVVHHGYNKYETATQLNKYGRYILFVGRRDSYKNFKNFVRAISSLMQKDKDLKLICVGAKFNKQEIVDLKDLKILEQAFALAVDEKTLNNLYACALVFVYPSFYEGFGMPILEAFANNCPVCLSDTSCFPEIAGEAGIYFNPSDEESIRCSITKVLNDSKYRSDMILAGNERLNQFSWKKTADETFVSYQKTLYSS